MIILRILALDQASLVTGYAVIEKTTTRTRLVRSGVIKGDSKLDVSVRLPQILTTISALITAQKPDVVVIEDIQKQSSIHSFKILANLQGMILWHCHEHGIKVDVLSPSVWRKYLSIKQGPGVRRWELKKQAIDYIKETYQRNVSEDEAEAICIGSAYALPPSKRNEKKEKSNDEEKV